MARPSGDRPLGIEDPSHDEGTLVERERVFVTALRYLENRISLFISLPFEKLEKSALQAHVREVGHGDGASSRRGDAA
jgi:arsenate reductase